MIKYILNRTAVRTAAASLSKPGRTPQAALAAVGRGYHTYPDPDETPVISTARSEAKHSIDKAGGDFQSMKKRYDMDKVFDIPEDIRSTPFSQQPKTKVTTLANGLTVATQDMPGLMCSISLLVETGSTAENQSGDSTDNTGTVQMLELTAFGDTPNMSREEIHETIEQLGGIVQCVAQRESITFFVDVFKSKMNESLKLLADSVLGAEISTEEVDAAKGDMAFMREMVQPEFISKDAVVMAAYRHQPLGNYHYCPEDRMEKINRDMLLDFKKKYFVPQNMIISASAVDHDSFVKSVQKAFDALPSAPSAGAATPVPPSTYTGGMYVEQRTLREDFVRCTVAFEAGGWNSDQFVAACVLQMLLGGGSSFSAGGPGKGMYTRLYREILNRYGWVESAEAFISCHRDVGLLGIDGSCRADGVGSIIQVFLDQLIQLTVKEVTPIELSRAKNMLKSMMFMQLESRLVVCEDIGKQLMVYNARKDTATLCAEIDRVSAGDLMSLARAMLKHDPAVAVVGHDVSTAPSFAAITQFTDEYKSEVWSKHGYRP